MSELKAIWEFIISLDHPIVFAIPLTVFIIVCRKQIGDLILRRFANPDNNDRPKEDTQPTEQSLPDTTSNLKDVDEELHFDPHLQPVLADQEQNIWTGIKKKHPKKYPEQRKNPLVKSLVKELAMVYTQADFEVLYGEIHGSQIRLLRKINERGNSVPYNEIHDYFLEIKKAFSTFYNNNATTDNYLAFLLDSSLIIRQGESYNMTIRGVEFLTWMSKVRKSENRYG